MSNTPFLFKTDNCLFNAVVLSVLSRTTNCVNKEFALKET